MTLTYTVPADGRLVLDLPEFKGMQVKLLVAKPRRPKKPRPQTDQEREYQRRLKALRDDRAKNDPYQHLTDEEYLQLLRRQREADDGSDNESWEEFRAFRARMGYYKP